MPGYPFDVNDKVHYTTEDHYLLDDFNVVTLNDSAVKLNGTSVPTYENATVVDAKNLFNVKGDITTDDTAAIQGALDYAATLSVWDGAFFPDRQAVVELGPGMTSSITAISIPQGVCLDLKGGELRAKQAGLTNLVTLAGDRSGIKNGFLECPNAGFEVGVTAIHIPLGVFQASVEYCWFNKFGQSAIKVEGNAAWIEKCWAQNCVLDADTLVTETGVLHCETTANDLWVSNCEFSASRTSAVGFLSASGKAYGVVVKGKAGTYKGIVAEISDHGFYIHGTSNTINKFSQCRADINAGHGFVFVGGGGSVIGCSANDNGREATNTYDGFNISASGGGSANMPTYQFVGCNADITLGNSHRYGFNDTAANNGFYSTYTSCRSTGHGTRAINVVTLGGGHVRCDEGNNFPIAAASTTQDVQAWGWPQKNWIFSSVAPVNFTNFTNGVPGQRLSVIGDGQTTFVHNIAAIRLKGGVNLLAAANTVYEFLWHSGVWIQI